MRYYPGFAFVALLDALRLAAVVFKILYIPYHDLISAAPERQIQSILCIVLALGDRLAADADADAPDASAAPEEA